MNISNRSINLLKEDNIKRYKGYILNEREDTFETYFALGKAFASCMESRHKTWDYAIERFAEAMKQEFMVADRLDDYDKYLVKLYESVENAKLAETERSEYSEFESIIPRDAKYKIKSKYDALYPDKIRDYKTVDTFTKEDEAIEKYRQQIEIYQWSERKRTDNKLNWEILEIKKWKRTLPTKKDDLIALLPEWTELKTVEDMKNYLYAHTSKEDISQIIVFPRDDALIERTEKLIKNAIRKIKWLSTLTLDEVL